MQGVTGRAGTAHLVDVVLAAASRDELAQVLQDAGVTPSQALEGIREMRAVVNGLTERLHAAKPGERPLRSFAEAEERLTVVRDTVRKHWPSRWDFIETNLAACATLLLKDVQASIALFGIASSGVGKTMMYKMLGSTELDRHVVVWVDDFSISSLLSAFSEEKADTLEANALFRLIQHKAMVTPELASMFRGRATGILQERFAKLARFLDGEGLTRASGTKALQGAHGDFTFVWLGGTTFFYAPTWRTMAQLGERLLFYRVGDIPQEQQVPEEAIGVAVRECREAVAKFLLDLFKRHEPRKVSWPEIPETLRAEVRELCELIADGHVIRSNVDTEGEPPQRPSPNHFRSRLLALAAGRALLHGRQVVDASDLEMVRHIVLSSMPGERGPVLLALHDANGISDVAGIRKATGLSEKVVRHTLDSLMGVDVVWYAAVGGGDAQKVGRPAGGWILSRRVPKPESAEANG